ncbi:MAG: DEAD/DEAH box helicase family protein [Geobacteraceae bacterium]|nr:DEAD/DEAH box helicase family protein [Geobacteraceae bacterium]
MFSFLSKEIAEEVREFLRSILPKTSENWWDSCVIPALSYQQLKMVEEKGISSIGQLDLAALLRILDRNWYDLAQANSLPREARNWLKELQSVRNRWAHQTGEEHSRDDKYRDLDTVQRFIETISKNTALIQQIKSLKQESGAIQASEVQSTTHPPAVKPSTVQPVTKQTCYSPGDMVTTKSNKNISGAVIQLLSQEPEERYQVFIDGKMQSYYASQLQFAAVEDTRRTVSLEDFHSALTALQLRHPGTASLYSLHAARINYIPYQYKPVIKLIRSDRPRILVADDVGVGKTIEAGLILRELQARHDISSVLIICPKPLVTERKWQTELKRFDEDFEHLDGDSLRFCINETDLDGVWPDKKRKVVIPFSLMSDEMINGSPGGGKKKPRKGLAELDPPPRFDLVIVDEAHHLRNPNTLVHQGVKYFCDNAEAVVFLTATPVQLGSDDLYVLLNLLRPDLVIDKPSFEHMAAPNPYINRSVTLARGASDGWQSEAREALLSASRTEWGQALFQENPDFQKTYDMLASDTITPDERISFIRSAEGLHTFATIINRTRRRDIGNFTTRKPETVSIPFTPDQEELHDAVLATQARVLSRLHGDRNLGFMMTTIRRQVASCIYGLVPLLNDILTRRLDELQLEESDDSIESLQTDSLAKITDEIKAIIGLASDIDPKDPKLEALLSVISDKQKLENNKILLFSSFRHTLAYLLDNIRNAGFRVDLIHGGIPDEDRRSLRNRFSLPREDKEALDILLSSEVGCEGLDYQFCDCLVNYDIPWNPMRVEQRIGRIDRYGQKSETVAIFNFITPGTVDADIYNRCLWRIGVFHATLGASEEIIGAITETLHDIADNLNLTEQERHKRLQQLADNEIRIVKEQAELEEQQSEFFGLRLPQQERDIQDYSSFWLSSTSLENLINQYLCKQFGDSQEYILGTKGIKTLRLGQEARNRLLEDFRTLQRKVTPVYRQWENWLKGSNQHLQLAFDGLNAAQDREVVLISPVHPLVLQAANAYEETIPVYCTAKVSSTTVKPGRYPFVVYRWHKFGIKDDFTFQPVCSDKNFSDAFMELMSKASPSTNSELPLQSEFDVLDGLHHRLWTNERIQHLEHNRLLAEFRRQSLTSSHNARIRILREQLAVASNTKIKLMRESEIKRVHADYDRRMQDIAKSESAADIQAQPVAFGIVTVA